MLGILSDIDNETTTRWPPSIRCAALKAAECSVHNGIHNFAIVHVLCFGCHLENNRKNTYKKAHLVDQNCCEVEGVGVDTLPRQSVGTSGGPTLAFARGSDLIRKDGGDSQENAGKDTHAD